MLTSASASRLHMPAPSCFAISPCGRRPGTLQSHGLLRAFVRSPPACPTSFTAPASAAGLRQEALCTFADSRRFLRNPGGPRAPSLGGVSPSLPCRLTLKKSPDARARARRPASSGYSCVLRPLLNCVRPATLALSAASRGWPGVTDRSPVLSTSLSPLTRVTERRHYLKRKSQPTPIFTTLNLSAQLSCYRNARPDV